MSQGLNIFNKLNSDIRNAPSLYSFQPKIKNSLLSCYQSNINVILYLLLAPKLGKRLISNGRLVKQYTTSVTPSKLFMFCIFFPEQGGRGPISPLASSRLPCHASTFFFCFRSVLCNICNVAK